MFNARTPRGRADVMYVTSTSEALVLRVELGGNEAFVSNYVKEGMNVTGLNNPDNLEIDGFGNRYIIEDNGPGDIWVARSVQQPDRVAEDVVRFASLSDCSAEPTGLLYDPWRKVMWVNVQHAGGALRNDLTIRIEPAR